MSAGHPDARQVHDQLRFLARRLDALLSEARALGLEPDPDIMSGLESLIRVLTAQMESASDV